MLAGCAAGGLLLSACATFSDQPPPEAWQPQENLTPQAGPDPQVPGQDGGSSEPPRGGGRPSEIPPPSGCTDYNPAVIETCLDTLFAVAALPGVGGAPAALVGERKTGRILRVVQDQEPVVIATLPVDAGSDGGLMGIALSPSYAEDQLVFAYITTPTDNRLVRLAPGDSAKPVISGIPRGATGNRGTLAQDSRGALLLATGDAGVPAAAADPKSLAGKLLRVTPTGRPADGNPTPGSAVVVSGLHAPGGICGTVDGAMTWVTDRAADRDFLYRIEFGKPLGAPAWTWPDRPGVAGCAATPRAVWVATSIAANLQSLPLGSDGSFSGKPQATLVDEEGFGRLGGMDLLTDQLAVAGTVNKDGGTPVSSDDRAFLIPLTGGGPGPD
jgi:glucose/arabinose dehydrogenase